MLQSNKNKSHRGRSKRVLMSTLLSHLTIINNVPARLDRDFALLLVLPPLPRPDILVREEIFVKVKFSLSEPGGPQSVLLNCNFHASNEIWNRLKCAFQ